LLKLDKNRDAPHARIVRASLLPRWLAQVIRCQHAFQSAHMKVDLKLSQNSRALLPFWRLVIFPIGWFPIQPVVLAHHFERKEEHPCVPKAYR
jgi:hypothetical protein